MKRVLVIGHRGMLGSDLLRFLERMGAREQLVEVRGVDLPEVDVTDPASLGHVFDDVRPEWVVNCAAFTQVDEAESRPDEAMRVNAEGAANIAVAAAGAKLVHLSTDYVFDGRKDGPYLEGDPPHPLSVYGRSKLKGERLVSRSAGDHVIVRTSWAYGAAGPNFVTRMLELAGAHDEIAVVADQRGSPTYTRELSRAIWELCKADARGIVHAAGGGSCSWYEFACEILRQSGLETRVRPITTAEAGRAAARPANSVLDTTRLRELTGFEFPPWRESLAGYLAERRSSREAPDEDKRSGGKL